MPAARCSTSPIGWTTRCWPRTPPKPSKSCTGRAREVRDREASTVPARFLPYRTLDDRIEGAVLTFIDITDRRRAEEELRAGEAHLKLLAQSTAATPSSPDCDGLITTRTAVPS